MPRKSPYAIELTPEERQWLQSRARKYTLSYRDVVRAMIILLAAEGRSNQEIADTLRLARPIVSKWRKRYWEEGPAGLQERPRGGRPLAFPPGGGV